MSFNDLINADVDFAGIGEWFSSLFEKISTNAVISNIWGNIQGYVQMVPAVAVTAVLLALSLLLVFAGRKLLGVEKFLLCLAVGFAVATVELAPHVASVISIDAWIVGLVVGVVAALLCKPIYLISYILVFGYSAYMICLGGYYLPEVITAFAKGNMIISIVAAVVVIIFALLLRKWVEIIGTAVLGSWLVSLCVNELLANFNLQFTESTASIANAVIITVFALLGFVHQAKKAKRNIKE